MKKMFFSFLFSIAVIFANAQTVLTFKIPQPFADSITVLYKGDIVNGKADGTGTAYDTADATIIYYQGQWKNNLPNGKGVCTPKSKSKYDGQWKNGNLNGKGVFVANNSDKYEGDFVDNKRVGKGIYTWNDGNTYDGDWVNNERTGKGVFTWKNGLMYNGDWVNNKRDGKGKMTFDNGTYDGDWVDNNRTGKGIFTWTSGEIYNGEFVEGKRTGKGIYTNAKGEVMDGYWENNNFVGRQLKGVSAQGVVPFKDARSNRYGFKDKDGKVIIEPKYAYATDFGVYDPNFSRVEANGSTGLVNAYGKEIAETKYFSIEQFSEGLAVARMGNNNYGFIDTTGKEVVPLTYNFAKSCINGFAIVSLDDKKNKEKRGAIDKTGKVVVPLKYDELYGFADDGWCLFIMGDKRGFVDKTGKEVLSFSKYDRISYFSHDRSSVSRKDKWGYIDRKGNEIIPLKYDMAEDFNEEGYGKVKVKDQYVLIDAMGNLAKGNAGFNISSKINVARDKWVVVTTKDLKASEPVYFLTSDKYGKNPAPFAAAITWQIIDDKGNVIKEQRTQAGESFGFKVPEDGNYTIQAYYDMRDCIGCRSEDKPDVFTMRYSFNTKL